MSALLVLKWSEFVVSVVEKAIVFTLDFVGETYILLVCSSNLFLIMKTVGPH